MPLAGHCRTVEKEKRGVQLPNLALCHSVHHCDEEAKANGERWLRASVREVKPHELSLLPVIRLVVRRAGHGSPGDGHGSGEEVCQRV